MYFDCFYFHVCLSLNWIFQRWMGFLKSPCGFLPVEPLSSNFIFMRCLFIWRCANMNCLSCNVNSFKYSHTQRTTTWWNWAGHRRQKKFRSEKRGLTRSVNSSWSIHRIRWVINDKQSIMQKFQNDSSSKLIMFQENDCTKQNLRGHSETEDLRDTKTKKILFSVLEITTLLP